MVKGRDLAHLAEASPKLLLQTDIFARVSPDEKLQLVRTYQAAGLLPLQLLFLNLVTDVFPAFALAMGEGEADVLNRPPRDPKEPILGRADWLLIVLH